MAAANLTTKVDFQMMHLVPDVVLLTKATTADWFSLTNYPGALILNAMVYTSVADTVTSAVEATYTQGGMKSTAVHTATVTAVTYDSAAATRLLPYYLFNGTSGEMMYVTADTGAATTTGTLTVRRGVLGTTAAAIADNAPLYVMNQFTLASAVVGKVILLIYPLPNEPGVQLFKAQNNA